MKPREPQKAVRSNSQPSAIQAERDSQLDEAEQEFGPRPTRRFGAMRMKLEVEPIPGYTQRWINDIPGRIADATECGYSHVTDNDGKPIYRVVGTSKHGGEMRAYRMKIPKVWYDENKAEEQEEHVDRVERDIYQGRAGKMVPGENGAYVPTYGPGGPSRIQVTTTR